MSPHYNVLRYAKSKNCNIIIREVSNTSEFFLIKELLNDPRVESVDVVTGDYELLLKLRTKDIDEYYQFVKEAIKKYKFSKTISMTSLKQLKTEFVKKVKSVKQAAWRNECSKYHGLSTALQRL